MDVIKEYKIIRGPATQLSFEVNESITEGWQPFGVPTVSDHKEHSYPILFQVMVKYDKG